jgi:predicted glycogen debranching enzyme
MIPPLVITPPAADAREYLRSREWLVTNGLGGYASGTLLGTPTRRYHGIFIPNLPSPRGRTVMVPRLDETVATGSVEARLGGAEFADGTAEGDGDRLTREFRLDCRTPTWRYEVGGVLLQKRITMPHAQNTVYVEYRLLEGDRVRVDLRPYVTFRQHDDPLGVPPEWPFSLTVARGRFEVHAYEGAPPLRLALRPRAGLFVVDERVSRDVFYRVERDRGYDHVEDLYSPGRFTLELRPGESAALVASTEPWDMLELDPAAIFDAERRRLEHLVTIAPPAAQTGTPAQLVLAADQFVILPGSRLEESVLAHAAGEHVRTVVAGYHWFTDWGRDTMISLEGLTLCTGRQAEARAILRTFSHYVKDGLIPNLFPEGQRTAIYNTADATLWYFHALDRYYTVTRDRETLELLFPVLESIVRHHVAGTEFCIGVDAADGLLAASAEGYQLTWMDAKVDGWVVTPRRGKPVEIQALWYNALRLMARWAAELRRPGEDFETLAARAFTSFNTRFWFEAGGHLFDVVDGPDGDDPSLRPNQIFSVSLRFPILEERRWGMVLGTVADRLLTPFGVRTLDPRHPAYRPRYEGNLWARDAAYHQGLVWPWLIGHFLDAWRRVHGPEPRARELLKGLEGHLLDAGIGTVSEIFDADPPHAPRGCVAQAWSVAELLRAWLAAA